MKNYLEIMFKEKNENQGMDIKDKKGKVVMDINDVQGYKKNTLKQCMEQIKYIFC